MLTRSGGRQASSNLPAAVFRDWKINFQNGAGSFKPEPAFTQDELFNANPEQEQMLAGFALPVRFNHIDDPSGHGERVWRSPARCRGEMARGWRGQHNGLGIRGERGGPDWKYSRPI
jgi:hypothetical protein